MHFMLRERQHMLSIDLLAHKVLVHGISLFQISYQKVTPS